MAKFENIAKDVVALIGSTKAMGITDKDIIALKRRYVTKYRTMNL